MTTEMVLTEQEVERAIAKVREQVKQSQQLIQSAEALIESTQQHLKQHAQQLVGKTPEELETLVASLDRHTQSQLKQDPLDYLERRLMVEQPSEEEERVASVVREVLSEQTYVASVFNGKKNTAKSDKATRPSRKVGLKI